MKKLAQLKSSGITGLSFIKIHFDNREHTIHDKQIFFHKRKIVLTYSKEKNKHALYAEMRRNRSITCVESVHKFAYMNGFGLHKIGHHSPCEFTSFTLVAQC